MHKENAWTPALFLALRSLSRFLPEDLLRERLHDDMNHSAVQGSLHARCVVSCRRHEGRAWVERTSNEDLLRQFQNILRGQRSVGPDDVGTLRLQQFLGLPALHGFDESSQSQNAGKMTRRGICHLSPAATRTAVSEGSRFRMTHRVKLQGFIYASRLRCVASGRSSAR